MRDYLPLGPAPAEEECAQVGSEDYRDKARRECERFVKGLELKFPPVPRARLGVKSFFHVFGTCFEVVVWFDDEDEEATQYAYDLEGNAPNTWAELEGKAK